MVTVHYNIQFSLKCFDSQTYFLFAKYKYPQLFSAAAFQIDQIRFKHN